MRARLLNKFNQLGKFRDACPPSLAKSVLPLQERASGEMAEWLKAHAWKACVRETVPWVRIPLSPPVARFCTPNYDFARLGSLDVPNARQWLARRTPVATKEDEEAPIFQIADRQRAPVLAA